MEQGYTCARLVDGGDCMSWVLDTLDELKDRYNELCEIREKLWDLISLIDELEDMLPSDIMGSHHGGMEYGDTLSQVEDEIQAIEDKVNQ